MKITTTTKSLLAIAAATTTALLLGGCSRGVTENDEEQPAKTENAISAGQLSGYNMTSGTYALTFDDGPGERTEELANWLGAQHIVATFFINGKNVPGHESAIAAIKANGHILANHTQNHEDMTGLSSGALFHAVADTDAYIAQVQPSGPWLLRAPYGSWNASVANELDGTSMSKYVGSIFWDIGGELTSTHAADWACWGQGVSIDDCADRYVNEMNDRESGISLMHDIHSNTVDMVKLVVARMGGASHFVSILNAPSIASAAGTTVPSSPQSPTTPTTSSCGDVTYRGFCTGDTVTWCEDDVLKSVDCTTKDKTCALENEENGYNCVD